MSLQRGQPNTVLKAIMADLNWYVEAVDNGVGGSSQDEGGWTGSNKVATSNHLGGTAFDYNWRDHPMGVALDGWHGSDIRPDQEEEPFVRDLLTYYTFEGLQLVWWANDWNAPKDSMHFQMGYGTFGDPRVQRFIDQKIKPDGFSRFKDEHPPSGPPPATDVVATLSQAMGNRDVVDYAAMVPLVAQCLQDSECTTDFRVAMWCAQIGTESGGLQWMEEIADGSKYEGRADLGNTSPGDGVKYKGRGPIQVTGKAHYGEFSEWAFDHGRVPTLTYFVDNPTELSKPEYGFLAASWYWTTTVRMRQPFHTLNEASDAQDVVTATHIVNGGERGLQDRLFRYQSCMRMGDRLLTLAAVTPPPLEPTPVEPVIELRWDLIAAQFVA